MFNNFPTIAHKSRAGKVDFYPYDFDASERHTRPKTGRDYWPYPWNGDSFAKLGAVSGIMPQLDGLVWSQFWAPAGYGPTMSAFPTNLQWQAAVPGLGKVIV